MKTRRESAVTLVPPLLAIAGVAVRLGVSSKTVRRLIARRELRAHRVGRLLRVTEEDLVEFLAKRRNVP
jgi:excisionase family DNA binding protein